MTAMIGGEDEDALGSAFLVDDTKKSERKRKRERQRRSDLTNALDELASLVSQIDPDESMDGSSAAAAAVQKKRRRKSGEEEAAIVQPPPSDLDNTNMTRLDLIGRATSVLKRLHSENLELRRRLVDQQSRSEGDDKVRTKFTVLAVIDSISQELEKSIDRLTRV